MTDRRRMTGRLVPLRSAAASDSRVGGTVDERLRLVTELSARAWRLTGRPLPRYGRADMPVHVTTLGARRDRD